jgi:hypothetical protein
MACPLGAIGTTASGRDKLRVPLVERRIFQDQQDIAVNPELQVADGQQDTGGFRSSVVDLFEASRERGFLLVGGQLRQQQRMAYADLIGIEAVPETVNPLTQNKLLLYFPLETVHDGAAEAASRGFYDIEDAPPWDTWFLYENDAVFCCVPEPAISAAQAGIDANPVDCIHWANWSELARVGK